MKIKKFFLVGILVGISFFVVSENANAFTETRITTNSSYQYSPSIYGDKIVWQDNRNGNWDIYMYNLTSSAETRITTYGSSNSPAIYGDKIVWENDNTGNGDIYMYDLSSSAETRITTNEAYQAFPAIYGDKIVWADNRNGNGDIYMYDLSSSTETQITADGSIQNYPAIYGDKIVWADYRNGGSDIYMYNLSSSTETRITTNGSDQYNPAIYDDKIVWEDNRNGNRDIYMYDLSSAIETRITTNTSNQYNPSIYGDRIVWQDARNDSGDIYMYELDTSTETRITTNTSNQYGSAIYADRVVWADARNDDGDIYTSIVSPNVKYWVGNGGNWADANHWAVTSGGAGGADIPIEDSEVHFDANSFTTAGQKVLFPTVENKLILNFEGEDGATTWTEEAQGLVPDYTYSLYELDTEKYHAGSSSLKIIASESSGAGVYYMVPGIGSNFTYTSYFQYHAVESWAQPLYVWDSDSNSSVDVELYKGNDNGDYLGIYGKDSAGNNFSNFDQINSLTADAWHKIELVVSDRNITIKIDNIEVNTWTATIDSPLSGLDHIGFWNGNSVSGNDLWVDSATLASDVTTTIKSLDMAHVSHPITLNSVGETDPWNISIPSGIIEAYNAILKNSQAIGGAVFNAFTSNSNVDGGGNSGWHFGCVEIRTPAELNDVRNDLSGCYVQMADIDMSAYSDYDPIGMVNFTEDLDEQKSLMFQGTYDGGNFKITNLNAPVFGFIGEEGTVKNINIPDALADGNTVTMNLPFGNLSFDGRGISIFNLGTISHCDVTGRAENGADNVLVGVGINLANQGIIENCYVNAELLNDTAHPTSFAETGITFVNAAPTSEFNLNGETGIVRRSFTNQKSDIHITALPTMLSNTLGIDSGSPVPITGLVEINSGVIEDCFAIFDVDAIANSVSVFGSVGFNYGGTVNRCYTTGEFSGEGMGVIANALSTASEQTIFDSYYSSDTGAAFVLDFAAVQQGYANWEELKTHLTPAEIAGYEAQGVLAAGVQKNNTELKTQSTFENWDFNNVWRIDEGAAYPVLRWTLSNDEEDNSDDVIIPVINLKDITNITKDSVKLEVEIPSHANQELDFTIKIFNKENDKTKEILATKISDNDSYVSLAVNDLDSSTNYRFSVKFSEHGQNNYSEYSNSKDAKTKDNIEGNECVPTKLKATAVSSSQINLTWEDNCDREDGYFIEQNKIGGKFEKIAKVNKNKKNYEAGGLLSYTTYVYRLRGYEGNHFTDYSNEASATTFSIHENPPIAPEEPAAIMTDPKITNKQTFPEIINKKPRETYIGKPSVKKVSTVIEIAGLLAGGSITLAATAVPLFPMSPTPFADGFSRLFSLFGFMGKTKRKNDWGIVFDVETRRPIKDAVVSIINKEGRVLDSIVTDKEGRYGFLTPDGTYTLQISKKNYTFKKDEKNDEFYGDVYTGEDLVIKQDEIIKMNMAMKIESVSWEEFAKRKVAAYISFFSIFKKNIFAFLFYAGFFTTAVMVYFSPSFSIFNASILALYTTIAFYRIFFKAKSFGTIMSKSKKPIPFAIVSLYAQQEPEKRLTFAVSDVVGRYYLLTKDGQYLMKIQGRELGSDYFTEICKVFVNNGIVNDDIVIE